ncbi:MAG: Maf family nucleotide pyrophosphatase [Candidatus Nitricoxidivorans perseverans]|uniref:7-methyl-GTP pyrophosphatase n=1 Tax=Candidatus Nitricoxidivorans perseverans TaxID=2975601 RepID=A0AA49FN57_9PROT|nr:MAG: Maf family nucleotide pyrophosphatase [Candidatus Nitricoxidivorans perseverans]
MPRLILASTSPFRRELLARLQIPFEAVAPDADESALPGESPAATAERLAVIKARAVAGRFPDALIIGSDQVAFLGEARFGKPGTRENAAAQLWAMSGKTVIFHTGLCLLNAATGRTHLRGVPTEVRFRELSDAEIARYLDREDALNCAGSAKSEGLGIALLESLRGDDPNALVGLPLIALAGMLRAEGVELP